MNEYQLILERYADRVVRSFGRRDAAEIKRELVSSLEDSLEDQLQGAEPTPEDALALLEEFGAPSDLAEKYRPSRYLISPRMFSPFVTTLKIMLLVQVIVFAVLTVISITAFGDVSDLFIFVYDFFQNVLTGFAIVTIIFWIIDRYSPEMTKVAEEVNEEFTAKEWDPNSLRNPNPEYVKKLGFIIESILLAAILFALHFFPEYLNIFGFTSLDTGKFIFLPIFGDGISKILPAISAIWGLRIAYNLFMLTQKTWNSTTKWVRFGSDVLSLVVLFLLAVTDGVFALTYADLVAGGFTEVQADALAGVLPWAVQGGLLIALVVNVILQGINFIQKITGNEWIKM